MDILLAEDNKIVSWLLKNSLEKNGHVVDLVECGADALRRFYRQYDAIILDICLPDMSGIEVAKIIRTKETYVNFIIAASTLGHLVKKDCLKVGFNEFYDKKNGVDELINILNRRTNEKINYQRSIQNVRSVCSKNNS